MPRRTVILVIILAAIAGAAPALATPRLALLSGSRCSACHYSPNGGGLRTDLGWSSMNQVGLFKWFQPAHQTNEPFAGSGEDLFSGGDHNTDSVGAEEPAETGEMGSPQDTVNTATAEPQDTSAPEVPTNGFFDGLVTPGLDVRLQLAKIGRPPNERRMLLPMQTNVYLAVDPSKWLSLFGGFNASTIEYRYPGQSAWEATALLHPDPEWPSLRIGYMQPSIGIRQDDHTAFGRREVAETGSPMIPPGYAELGTELSYEGIHWITVNAGVFSGYNLSEVDPTVESSSIADFSSPSVLGRIVLWPQLLDLGFNGELGASWFGNGDFQMLSAFVGLGLSERGSIMVEGVYAQNAAERRVRNLSVSGSYFLANWLSIDWRYEWAQTEYPASRLFHANAAVFGLEFFPFPYIELRPEYRFFEREPFGEIGGTLSGQYAIQLHIFY